MTRAEAIALEEYRRAHVPLYNDQKLKLGVFGINCSYGLNISARAHHLQGDLGAHLRDRQARRRHGFRAGPAGGALARLRRHDRLQRRIVRDLHLGGGAGAGDQEHHGRRDLARADGASHRRRQAGGDHRPHLQRPLRAQSRDGLVHAGDGDVPGHAAGARRSLPLRRRVARRSSSACGPRRRRSISRRRISTSSRRRPIPSRSRSPIRS